MARNIHYHFTYMDSEGQSYAFLSDFLLSFNPSEDRCLRTGKGLHVEVFCFKRNAAATTTTEIPAVLESMPDFVIPQSNILIL